MLSIGHKFPSFKTQACVSTEPGKEFATVSNDTYAGKWMIFYAYPKDFTFICPTEIIEFDDKAKEFAKRDAVVVGGSTDNEFSHLAWRNNHKGLAGINTPLVHINPDLATQLGIVHPDAGAAVRATFIVDPHGMIRAVTATDLSVGRNVDEIVRQLDALQTEQLTPCNWKPGEKTLGAA